MKMNGLLRTVSTCLIVSLFAGMAIASGSSNSERGSVTVSDSTANDAGATTTTTTEAEETIQYEITHTTFSHHTNSIGREEYFGAIEIKNTGSSYIYLENCTFDLEDDEGHLLQNDSLVVSAPNVIAPNECGYFFNNGLIDEGVSLDNGINLVPNFTLEVCSLGSTAIVEYELSDLSLRDNDYGLGVKVTGRVTNNTSEDTNSIDVMIIAVFFDGDGEIIDIGYTYADEMPVDAQVSFEISTVFGNEEVSTENIADYQVIARKTYMQF